MPPARDTIILVLALVALIVLAFGHLTSDPWRPNSTRVGAFLGVLSWFLWLVWK
jgi:hypothetical protein